MRPQYSTRDPASPRRRWVHRLPVPVRQHWKIVAAFAVFVTVLATVFGGTRIIPQITGDTKVIASEITDNISGTVDLFDTSVSHEVSLEITEAEYQDMITTFEKSGDKKWVTADITIDGTFINDVSIRLKGNSTLMGVRGDVARPGGNDFAPPEGMEMPEGMPAGSNPMAAMGPQATAEDPLSLPLLISFDENASGRAYQGMTELSVRPGTPVLNEALSLSLTAETGQPTQRYVYTTYSINDGAATTRLLLEHPDATHADSLFDSDGYLYKADANSRFEYVGDDQSDYADQFKQINAADSGNLQPIINFLKWMDSADSAEFDAHLADWVDVDSFARYVATQNLIANGDDMSGPGQNYYLWYDLDTQKITVISWDLNLAMSGEATGGPHDSVSLGFGPREVPDSGTETGDTVQPADTAEGAGDGQNQDQQPQEAGNGRGGPGRANPLETRFLESEAFTAVYESAYWELFDQMYGSGLAAELLDELADTIPVTDGLDAETLQAEIDELHTWIDQRTATLSALRAA
ncbi:CotH kinase family protein [Nocardia testacea]|uniref:CotH kinase family protein n=1 Tax=Nocardia testacea TaxID=248551 RepID=A0ABW7VPZ9_9NOCA